MAEFENFFRYLLPGFAFGIILTLFGTIIDFFALEDLNGGIINSLITLVTAGILGYFISQVYWLLHDNGNFGINHTKLFNQLIEEEKIQVTINKKRIEKFEKPHYTSQWVIMSQLWYSDYSKVNPGIIAKIDRLSHIIHGTGAVIIATAIATIIGNVGFLYYFFNKTSELEFGNFLLLNFTIIIMMIVLCLNYTHSKSKYEFLVHNSLTKHNEASTSKTHFDF